MPNVYAYRLAPSGFDHVVALLNANQIAIGWSKARNLIDRNLTIDDFRTELSKVYEDHQGKDRNERYRLSKSTTQTWRFLRELAIGDIVLVPHEKKAHFLRVAGEPIYIDHPAQPDTSLRRDITKIKTVDFSDLPDAIRIKITGFRPASLVLDEIKEDVLAFLGLDPVVVAQEERSEQATRLLMEAIGSYQIGPKDGKTVDRRHADVSKDLIKHLESKGRKVGNNRIHGLAPDLFTVGEEPDSLFEIKIGTGSGDYLKAIGQLLVYEKLLKSPYRKFLVAPPGLRGVAREILASFDIGIIEYTELDGKFSFVWPSKVETKTATPISIKLR